MKKKRARKKIGGGRNKREGKGNKRVSLEVKEEKDKASRERSVKKTVRAEMHERRRMKDGREGRTRERNEERVEMRKGGRKEEKQE